MTVEASGLVVFGSIQFRPLAGTPWDLSAPHMTGSHDTTAVLLTCCATQAAARSRVTFSALPTLVLRPVGTGGFPVCPDRAIVSAPAPVSVRTATTTPVICRRRPTVGRRLGR